MIDSPGSPHLPILPLGFLLLVAACGGGTGEGLDANGRPLGEAATVAEVSGDFASIRANILAPTCAFSGCHSGAGAPLGLNLDEAVAFDSLVNVASVQQPALLRVSPGDPDNSYLVRKLEGSAGITGRSMPRGGQRLPGDALASIRQWIAAGAPRSVGTSGGSPPPRVVSTDPPAGAITASLPGALTIAFDQVMDPVTFADLTVAFVGSGGDSGFGDGNEVALAPLGLVLDNAQTNLTVDLAGFAAGEDCYQLTLRGTGPSVLRSAEAIVLDGDGDGRAGGDFTALLSVGRATGTVEPTFASLRDNLLTPTCAISGCHSGPSPSGGLNLEPDQAYDNLLDPGSSRVRPGEPDRSLLFNFVDGGFMPAIKPPGFDCQRQVFADAIEAWIANGAAR